LINFWIDEHDTYHPAGCTPLLVMDVWEHAFAIDYGTDRESYIDAFMNNVNWSAAETRLRATADAVRRLDESADELMTERAPNDHEIERNGIPHE
jgi:hypothetical protein